MAVLKQNLSCQEVTSTHGIASEVYTLTEANGRRLDQRSVAVEWEVTAPAELIDWTEDTTAEDNGHEAIITGAQAGSLDNTEGLVYVGAAPTQVRVVATNIDVAEGTIILEEEDLVSVTLFRNSEAVWHSDEGFVTIEEAATEFNFDAGPISLVENDVLRLCATLGLNALGQEVAEDGIQVEIAEEVGELVIMSYA